MLMNPEYEILREWLQRINPSSNYPHKVHICRNCLEVIIGVFLALMLIGGAYTMFFSNDPYLVKAYVLDNSVIIGTFITFFCMVMLYSATAYYEKQYTPILEYRHGMTEMASSELIYHLQRAMEGDAHSMFLAGRYISKGIGAEQCETDGFTLIAYAALAGESIASETLAYAYAYGPFTNNEDLHCQWINTSLSQGADPNRFSHRVIKDVPPISVSKLFKLTLDDITRLEK